MRLYRRGDNYLYTDERKGSVFMKKIRLITSIILMLLSVAMLVSCSAGKESNSAMNDSYSGEIAPEKGDVLMDIEYEDHSKIIKTISAHGETKNYDECIEKIKALVNEHHGYTETSNVSGNSYNSERSSRRASFVFRIPAESLESFKDDISKLLNVTSLSENAKNVSQEYYDIAAIIETLSAERDGLLNILKSLDNSNQYDYWLTITERLSDIEKQIAMYTAQLKNLDNKIAYSTYSLTVEEVKEYTEDAPEGFGDRISLALKESWQDFIDSSQDFIVGIVYLIPTILTICVVGGGITAIIVFANKKFGKKNK